MRHLLHFYVFGFQEELVRAGEVFHDLFVLAMPGDELLEFSVLLGDLLEARGIPHHFRRRELLRHFFVARIELVQFFRQCKNRHRNLGF